MLVALGALRATSLAGRTACCLDGLALAILGLQALLAGRDTLLCTRSWYTCDTRLAQQGGKRTPMQQKVSKPNRRSKLTDTLQCLNAAQ